MSPVSEGAKITKKEHLEQVARSTGQPIEEFIELPELPLEGQYLWDLFTEIKTGGEPLTQQELLAWSTLSGIALARWERRALRALDRIYR